MQTAVVVSTLEALGGVPSNARSKRVVRLLIRNPYGALMHAGLFGEPLPPPLEDSVRRTMERVRAGELVGEDGQPVPSYGYLGDALLALQPDVQRELDSWVQANLAAYASERTTETPISENGARALRLFYEKFVEHFVVNKASWTIADTQMLVLLLHSYQNFEAPLFSHFGARLGQGIVPSLHAYRQGLKSHPLDVECKSDDPALVLDTLSPILL